MEFFPVNQRMRRMKTTSMKVNKKWNITRLRTNEDIGTLLQDHPVFVNTKQLMELARTTVSLNCKVKGCGGIVQMSMQTVSSATYLKWVSMILCSMQFHLSLSNNIKSCQF